MFKNWSTRVSIILLGTSVTSFGFLSSLPTFASNTTVSDIDITVPVSCNIITTLDSPHTATINPGQSVENIGTTTFNVFCNDNAGYAIYAIGYSNQEYGNTNMIATVGGS
ncbi:hypothetical protein J6Z37_01485, partial [Candidatus Saccharibacteria bacterium]|nr:hypothetical protein [Candidatus Saccharibacteria bacterium]